MKKLPNSSTPRHQWYLADALLLVRRLQEVVWPVNYHVALGGGVLNHGYSDKDLDLYILPLNRHARSEDVQPVIRSVLTFIKPIGEDRYESLPTVAMESSDQYAYDGGKRVDVFVVKGHITRIIERLE